MPFLASALACAPSDDATGDGDESSGATTTMPTSDTGGSSEDGPAVDTSESTATTVTATSSSESEDGDSETSGGPGGTDSSGGTTEDGGSEDTGTTGDAGWTVADGQWCGNVGTGVQVLDASASATFAPTDTRHGGPKAFAVWTRGIDGLHAAVYDRAAGTWEATMTLEESDAAEHGAQPTAAVDAQGNAVLVSGDNLAAPVVRAHRYGAATGTWTTAVLPDAVLTHVGAVRVRTTADGDAIAVAEDHIDDMQFAFVHWFYDAALDEWSAPLAAGPATGSSPRMPWAQDPVTGDAAFLLSVSSTTAQLRHRSAAGEWIIEDLDVSGLPYFYPHAVVAIGDGAFVAIADSGSFLADNNAIHAYVFDDGAWQPGLQTFVGTSPSGIRIVATPDGRALASWFLDDSSTVQARAYDTSVGWSATYDVNAGQQGDEYVGYQTAALDEGGFVVAWSQLHVDTVRTYARRHDAVEGWSDIAELDPDQPALSQVVAVNALAADITRVLWVRDQGNANYTGWFYACHSPQTGWTDATATTVDWVGLLQPYSEGEVLVGGYDGAASLVAEYYAAPQ